MDTKDQNVGAQMALIPAGIEPGRLERSLVLVSERVANGQYRVSGGEDPHWVDLFDPAHPRCDCADHLWRDAICKHILTAMLREGDERVVQALARLVATLREMAHDGDARAA